MKYAVVAYLRRIIALLTSFFLLLCPVKENGEKPETTQPANSIAAYNPAEADYLLTAPDALSHVGRDKVKLARYALPYGFGRSESFVGINVTVASARLDGVISALISVSREKAKSMVRGGLVQVDHVEVFDPDTTVADGCVITVRGKGKFKIESINERAKKDRLRLVALKFV